MRPEGIALGVPTSAILGVPTSAIFSQIYLQQVERKYVVNLLTKPKLVGYFRDVDDITIALYNTNKFTQLHMEFNRQYYNLFLKLEIK
jgi:hypothetical protein